MGEIKERLYEVPFEMVNNTEFSIIKKIKSISPVFEAK